ncbi:hypothetical protein ONZ45_g6792 [Pleurotus djamor]|nr:hypothetical protein ONZ45_g6792 [Pleurotus djamor]
MSSLFDIVQEVAMYHEQHSMRASPEVTFDVDGLTNFAAESVNHRLPTGVISISEGGFNRTFVITLRDVKQPVF